MSRTALIVGAGIGGLSAGIALRKAGWTVRLFERAASPRELGFGVSLAPNAIEGLRALGVADAVLAQAAAPRRGELRRLDGTPLKRAELPPNALGGPMVIALRQSLHGALLAAVGIDAIRLDSAVTGFSMTSHGARVHLAGGDSVEGDLLVGADGVGSAIRRELHPLEPPPRSSHIVAVRGAVHGALEHLRGLDAIGYLGPGVEAMFIRASDTGMYWYYSMASELLPPDLRDARAVLACMTPQMDHTVRTITSTTEDLRCDELFDRDPIPTWGRGPVTLVGDAAHPVLPHTGQGAAQAIVDAVTLGRMLNDVGHLDATLRAYEAERRAKTSALLTKGRHTARFMRTRHPLACTLRELFIRLIPVTTGARLYASISRKAGTDVRA